MGREPKKNICHTTEKMEKKIMTAPVWESLIVEIAKMG